MMRILTEEDLSQLLVIETETQISPWSEEVFKKCFNVGSIGWVIETPEAVVAFILILIQAGEAHILNLCVHPNYQHQGLGYQLLVNSLHEVLQQGAAMAYLEVRCSNFKAISLYKKLGFNQIGIRKAYYATLNGREDALIFAKPLLGR